MLILQAHLAGYVDGGVLTFSEAHWVSRYVYDVDIGRTNGKRADLKSVEIRMGGPQPWSQDSEQAKKRVKDANAAMGPLMQHIVHLVGYKNESFQEIATKEGFDDPGEVKLFFKRGAKALRGVYEVR